MPHPAVVLSIAGSDSSGGAGIQADIKTISALGAYAATAVTALTAQNTLAVRAIHAPPHGFLREQLNAVLEDLRVAAVKIGMLHNEDVVGAVHDSLHDHVARNIVLDPVMVATSGSTLITPKTAETIVSRLFPLADLITPNLDEACYLLNSPIRTVDDMPAAAKALQNLGARNVLLKGGHLLGVNGEPSDQIVDFLLMQDGEHHIFRQDRIDTKNTHGTGCSLSSAIATYLAFGNDLPEAVRLAQTYVHQGLMEARELRIGQGAGPINHLYQPAAMRFLST